MELIVFDLDGTLLNAQQRISPYTTETLRLLGERHIAYTVATGRTLHASKACLAGHNFLLPHVYKNGVVIWDPRLSGYTHQNLLTRQEIDAVLTSFAKHPVTPFVFTVEDDGVHAVYHPPVSSASCKHFLHELSDNRGLPLLPLTALPQDACITNISALGDGEAVKAIGEDLQAYDHLVAYFGQGLYDAGSYWMDIHHSSASKGGAVELLKQDLGFERIICFGDGDNDASLFALADESYAPENAIDEIKAMATEVIGHHDQDGIARFLRQRFEL
ncbi:MAG: HAD-IIB family hydrolase [Natronospirillum sp.]